MIIIASDHAGLILKNKIVKWLTKNNLEVEDVGANSFDTSDSFVSFAKLAIDHFVKLNNSEKDNYLILVCGSGVGMNIVANRNKSINAVLATTKKQAIQGREHNNCNCLCLGARNTSFSVAKSIINSFLKTEFLGGKYLTRMNSIDEV